MSSLKKKNVCVCTSILALILTALMMILTLFGPNQPPDFDYHQLIDIPFNFLRRPKCHTKYNFVVLVHTAPENADRRKILRETWASRYETDADIFFVVGTSIDRKIEEKLYAEMREYDDFIQGDFDDTYHNLSYKHVMCLKYVFYHCPHVDFLVKVDDDVYLNINILERFLEVFVQMRGQTNEIMCALNNGPVLRSGKWAVKIEDYPDSTYPPYCLGFALIYPKNVIERLYLQVQKTDFFWIDDVFITGLVAKKAGIEHTGFYPLMMNMREMNISLTPEFNLDIRPVIFGPLEIKTNQIRILHEFIKNHGHRSLLDMLT